MASKFGFHTILKGFVLLVYASATQALLFSSTPAEKSLFSEITWKGSPIFIPAGYGISDVKEVVRGVEEDIVYLWEPRSLELRAETTQCDDGCDTWIPFEEFNVDPDGALLREEQEGTVIFVDSDDQQLFSGPNEAAFPVERRTPTPAQHPSQSPSLTPPASPLATPSPVSDNKVGSVNLSGREKRARVCASKDYQKAKKNKATGAITPEVGHPGHWVFARTFPSSGDLDDKKSIWYDFKEPRDKTTIDKKEAWDFDQLPLKRSNSKYGSEHVLEWQLLAMFLNSYRDQYAKDNKNEDICDKLVPYWLDPVNLVDFTDKLKHGDGSLPAMLNVAYQFPGKDFQRDEFLGLQSGVNGAKMRAWKIVNLTKKATQKNGVIEEKESNNDAIEWLVKNLSKSKGSKSTRNDKENRRPMAAIGKTAEIMGIWTYHSHDDVAKIFKDQAQRIYNGFKEMDEVVLPAATGPNSKFKDSKGAPLVAPWTRINIAEAWKKWIKGHHDDVKKHVEDTLVYHMKLLNEEKNGQLSNKGTISDMKICEDGSNDEVKRRIEVLNEVYEDVKKRPWDFSLA